MGLPPVDDSHARLLPFLHDSLDLGRDVILEDDLNLDVDDATCADERIGHAYVGIDIFRTTGLMRFLITDSTPTLDPNSPATPRFRQIRFMGPSG